MTTNAVLLEVLLISLTVTGCDKNQSQKNVCPIDGQQPQWVGQKNGKSCEFFHYSDIERHPHSWWADCEQGGTQQQNSLPSSPPQNQP
jgi:hypothetical protein